MLPFANTKKAAKTTAKSLAKSAITLKTSIEFAVQPLMEDLKTKDQLEKIANHFQELEKLLLEKTKHDTAELAKVFEKSEEELNKIIKKLRGFQEYTALAEQSLQEKLLSKVNQLKEAKKDVKVQEEYKNQAQRLIAEITMVINNAKKKVTELAEKAETVVKHHALLKPKLAIYSLPESLSQSDKQAKKLKERLELVCQASTGLNPNAFTALGLEKDSVSSFLPHLENNIKSCAQLIERACLNLKPILNSNGALNVNGTNGSQAAGLNSAAKLVKSEVNQSSAQDMKDVKDAKNDSRFNVAVNL